MKLKKIIVNFIFLFTNSYKPQIIIHKHLKQQQHVKRSIGIIPIIQIIHKLRFPRKKVIFWWNKLKMEPVVNNQHTFYRQLIVIKFYQH